MPKVGRKPSRLCGQLCFCLGYPLRGCFLSAAFHAAADNFLLLRQKKVTKEKATRRRRNSRTSGRHPGAAHPLRSKEGGLFPGWRPLVRPAPTGMGHVGSVLTGGGVVCGQPCLIPELLLSSFSRLITVFAKRKLPKKRRPDGAGVPVAAATIPAPPIRCAQKRAACFRVGGRCYGLRQRDGARRFGVGDRTRFHGQPCVIGRPSRCDLP